jgi:hypothetical protein
MMLSGIKTTWGKGSADGLASQRGYLYILLPVLPRNLPQAANATPMEMMQDSSIVHKFVCFTIGMATAAQGIYQVWFTSPSLISAKRQYLFPITCKFSMSVNLPHVSV